jgi:hypothetical protein
MKLLSVNVSLPKEVPYTNKTTGMRRVEEPDLALRLNCTTRQWGLVGLAEGESKPIVELI